MRGLRGGAFNGSIGAADINPIGEAVSYYNWVNLQYLEGEELDFASVEDALRAYLAKKGIHEDVLQDLAALFADGEAELKLHTAMLDELLQRVSEEAPEVLFGVQGRGEELRDVWVREYSAGEKTFAEGPFHES